MFSFRRVLKWIGGSRNGVYIERCFPFADMLLMENPKYLSDWVSPVLDLLPWKMKPPCLVDEELFEKQTKMQRPSLDMQINQVPAFLVLNDS